MERHITLLNDVCRICGVYRSRRQRPFMPVSNFKEEIFYTFCLNIADDDENVHPRKICHKCRSKSNYHFQKRQKDGGQIGTYQSELKQFVPHCYDHCQICHSSEQSPRERNESSPNSYPSGLITSTICDSAQSKSPFSNSPERTISTICHSSEQKTVKRFEPVTSLQGLLDNSRPPKPITSFESLLRRTADLTAEIKNLPIELQEKLARSLGESQSKNIYEDSVGHANDYQNPEKLIYPDADAWLSKRNSVAVAFVEGTTQSSSKYRNNHGKSHYAQAKAIDGIYKARNSNFVSTLSFPETVTLYSITGSKAAVNINSASSASGGFSTIQAWLKSRAKGNPVLFPESGDLFVAIDNEQVVGKTWRVYANRKLPTSIVTSIIGMQLTSNEQKKRLLPSIFSSKYCTYALDNILARPIQACSSVTASTELKAYMQSRLALLEDEHSATLTGWVDDIDKTLAIGDAEELACSACGKKQDASAGSEPSDVPSCSRCGSTCWKKIQATRNLKRKASFFRVDPVSTTRKRKMAKLDGTSSTVENDLGVKCSDGLERKNAPILHVADPAFVNPNSYETVAGVLKHVGRCAGISKYGTGDRKWTLVIMDGLPFSLAYNIVQNTFVCRICPDVPIYGKVQKDQHCDEFHHSEDVCGREFDWVVLRIGAGHFEMNMKKSFMDLNFSPFMSDICSELGFKTANAQRFARECGDNHKAWDLLCIARESLADELLRPYVLQCLAQKEPCSPKGYVEYAKQVKNPNYKFIYEQVFVYLQAIINFRTGLRGNNHDLLLAGKEKFSPLWFVRNHPKYQLIDICDGHDRFCYPDNVQALVRDHESFSFTGNPKTGEGLDFVLENVNKKVKSFLSPGVPDSNDWLRSFRNYHQLDSIRHSTFARMGLTDPSNVASSPRRRDYSEEVEKCRHMIRKSGILKEPKEECEFHSPSGKKLDLDLLSLTSRGIKNKGIFVQSLKVKGKPPKDQMVYVVTCDDELTVQSRIVTKASLTAIIEEKLSNLRTGVTSEYLHESWKEIKKGKKQGYLNLLDEVKQAEIKGDDNEITDF